MRQRCLQLIPKLEVKLISPLLLALTFAACLNRPHEKVTSQKAASRDTIAKSYVDTIKELENLSMTVNYDSLGQLISNIRFDVKNK